MTGGASSHLGLDDLLAYLVDRSPASQAPGDPGTPDDQLETVEEHLFACDDCARRLDELDAVRSAVADAVRRAELGGSVNRAVLDRLVRDGLSVREYRIPEGGAVQCAAGPEDLVLVRLAAGDLPRPAGEPLVLEVAFDDLERGESTEIPPREVLADRELGEVLLLFLGETVRTYPRSRWTLRLTDGATYVMDHTPGTTPRDS